MLAIFLFLNELWAYFYCTCAETATWEFPVKNVTPTSPFDPVTSISYSRIFPLSDDVCGICLIYLCSVFMLPCNIDIRPIDLDGVSCIKLHTADAHVNCELRTIIRSWVMDDSTWSRFHHMERPVRMRRVPLRITEGTMIHVFEISDLCKFQSATTKSHVIGVK